MEHSEIFDTFVTFDLSDQQKDNDKDIERTVSMSNPETCEH